MKQILDYIRAVVGEQGQPPPASLEDLQHQLQAELITQEAFTKGGLALTQYLRESGLELVPADQIKEREDRIKTLTDRLAIMEGQAAAYRADLDRHIKEVEAAAAQPIEEPWPLLVFIATRFSMPDPGDAVWIRFSRFSGLDDRVIRVGSRLGIRHWRTDAGVGEESQVVVWGTVAEQVDGGDLPGHELWRFTRDDDGQATPALYPFVEEGAQALIYIAEEPVETIQHYKDVIHPFQPGGYGGFNNVVGYNTFDPPKEPQG